MLIAITSGNNGKVLPPILTGMTVQHMRKTGVFRM
jgi:hypothetical protein